MERTLIRYVLAYMALTVVTTGVLTLIIRMEFGNALFIALHISLLLVIGISYLIRPSFRQEQDRD